MIGKEQLQFYLENGFSVPSIAKMINVSKSTVKRRLKELRLSVSSCFSSIVDDELDAAVRDLLGRYPNCGYCRMNGLLLTKAIRVLEKRKRCSMHRVDPEGVLLRALQLSTVNRRTYRVPGILSLWHIDGHHKLIRYASCTFPYPIM